VARELPETVEPDPPIPTNQFDSVGFALIQPLRPSAKPANPALITPDAVIERSAHETQKSPKWFDLV
jgi:hypothetical protein